MRQVFDPSWRTQNRRKRKFYAKYMRWLEFVGYTVVALVLGSFIVAFNYKVDDLVTADKVKIEPAATVVNANDVSLVVAEFVEADEEVSAGAKLVEVVEGQDAIARYEAWKAVKDVVGATGRASAETDTLLKRHPKPPTRILTAPVKGWYVPAGDYYTGRNRKTVEQGKEILRVVDYNDLRLSASLAGQTVASAQAGQPATITSISIEPKDGLLLRGSGAGGAFLSGSLLSPDLKKELNGALAGKAVKVRDDIPLKISEISEVQVDAVVSEQEGDGSGQMLDPTQRFKVQATVLEGEPSATVQLADLPPDLATKAEELVKKSVDKRAAVTPDGKPIVLSDTRDVRFVLKAKAVKGESLDGALAGTPLTRTFDAKLKIDNPPAFLINAVRSGAPVTARVELRTGTRPIAFILLRKS